MIWRALLTLAALLGLWAGGVLSLAHLKTGEVCPMIGPVPACFVVLAGYTLIFAAAWAPRTAAPFVFAAGFTQVFGLAATGVALELAHGDICPKTSGGIPQCFLSFALAALTLILFLRARLRVGPAGRSRGA